MVCMVPAWSKEPKLVSEWMLNLLCTYEAFAHKPISESLLVHIYHKKVLYVPCSDKLKGIFTTSRT